MKKGIAAIEAQIDSVTAYREREKKNQSEPKIVSIQAERQERKLECTCPPVGLGQYDDNTPDHNCPLHGCRGFDEPHGYCS